MTDHQQYQQGPILEGPVAPAPMPTQATPMPPMQPQQYYNPMHKDPGESLAIASLVVSVLGVSVIGLIPGVISFGQSKKGGYHKNGMAVAGVIIGTVYIAIFVLFLIFVVVVSVVSSGNSMTTY